MVVVGGRGGSNLTLRWISTFNQAGEKGEESSDILPKPQ